MAPAPKKATKALPAKGKPAAAKKPRLSQAEAQARMLQASINLLLVHPPADVTVHMIADAAGVHHDYIARYFGSREELMIQSAEAPMTGVLTAAQFSGGENLRPSVNPADDMFKMAAVRYRLISYLLACGVDPERFVNTQTMMIESGMTLFANPELSERTKRNFVMMSIMLAQSIHLMSEINGMSEQDVDDVMGFIRGAGSYAPAVQSALGWDQEPPKKKTKPSKK